MFTKLRGITIAEISVTLLIVGIIAIMLIPSLIESNKQVQYRAGLKKAVNTINEAISINIAKGRKSAFYTTEDAALFDYLQKGIKTVGATPNAIRTNKNSEFHTKDNLRFEFPKANQGSAEFSGLKIKNDTTTTSLSVKSYKCGTYGMDIGGSADAQKEQPCIILVDVNGYKNPNALSGNSTKDLSDMFLILVTDKGAFPYGEAAQKVYYNKD